MEYVLLIGVVVILAGMFVAGYSSGLIRILLSFAATVVAFILALVLASPFQTFIKNDTPIYDGMNKQMTKYVSKYISESADASSEELQKESINNLKMPSVIKDKLVKNNTADEKLTMGVDTFSEYVACSLTDILLQAISVCILFICIKLIFPGVI